MTDLPKLNRLRTNAGKPELKSWKASKEKLADAIKTLEDAGHTDVISGANPDAAPVTDDPEVLKALTPKDDETPSLADSALSKNVDNSDKPKAKAETIKGPASLARGLDTDSYAKHSRERVRDIREAEKKAKKDKKIELSDNDKRQIKDEADSRKVKPVGAVDAKREPEKAKRQLKHIEEKQAKRAAKKDKAPAKEKPTDVVTIADIARELDKDPKIVRAKARRHEDKLTSLHSKGQDRWTFPKSAHKKLLEILG